MTELLKNLIEFYQEEPNDPFNIYGLALEYQKFDKVKARFYFEELLNQFEEYTPTYYHAAAFYLDINEIELAQKTYQKGIEITNNLNKMHANAELKRAYRSFLDELED